MIEKDKALANPASIFDSPEAVLEEKSLSKNEKIQLLHQWIYDVNELTVAEEENMPSAGDNVETNYGSLLQQIHAALDELGDTRDESIGGATKHGLG